jgi:hypothetical protein
VAVTQHSDPTIFESFQTAGGTQVDLAEQDTVVNMLYFAPPVIEVTGLNALAPCSQVVYEQGTQVTLTIKLAEDYYGGRCYVDTAAVRVINGIAGTTQDTALGGPARSLVYKFKAGTPNSVPPHLQTIQIIATTESGNEVSFVKQAIVTGVRNKENTFATYMPPPTPSMILRDPPGDGSYSYLEKDEITCTTTEIMFDYEVGGGAGLEWHLGGNVEVVVGLFAATIINTGIVADVAVDAQLTYQKITDSTFQVCTQHNSRITTDDGELLTGRGGGADLFMGSAFNLKFGLADKVSFDPLTCTTSVDTVVNILPDTFATSFIYSEFYIKNYLIPYMSLLENADSTSTQDSLKYALSKKRWQYYVDWNDTLKAKSPAVRNHSFDGGVTYEYSDVFETSKSISTETFLNSEELLETHLGYTFNNFGVVGHLRFVSATSQSTKKVKDKAYITSYGYVLHDDDPGDAFSVDVALDTFYYSPVFRTVAGQSSCPWEPGTAHREGCLMSLRDSSGSVAVDVPANEPAVFKFTLGNTSAVNETHTYAFTAGPESNPDGAVIKLNGAVLDHPVLYAIPYGTSIPITVTVERGPEKYDYDDLELVFYSECEDTRAGNLGITPDDDTILYSAIYVSAHFIKPCSEVDISFPQAGWVIHPDTSAATNDDLLPITLTGYDRTDLDLDVVRLQYRAIGGDGAWINIGKTSNLQNPDGSIPRDSLRSVFTRVDWNTAGLKDGPYEIRALAVCTGDLKDNPGMSHVIQGRIEREPPYIVGVPEPSDGVFNVGDEISVTFNKDLDCSKIFQADIMNPNNVGLYDAATGTLIDFTKYCIGNKIELGVLCGPQRTRLADRQRRPDQVRGRDQNRTANIHNRGGYPVPFKILGVPDWVHVVPNTGTLGAQRNPAHLALGGFHAGLRHWRDTIVLETQTGQNPFFMGGDENIPIGVRVVCAPPDWNLNAGIHPVTMNMVVALNIEGVLSTDEEDLVAAYINDELRGRANIRYYPAVNKYLAHLTIYGESAEVNSPINLQIWDASACLRYGTVVETFTFQPDNVVGTPVNPQVLHTNSLVLRDIPLSLGWNWISFNLQFPDPAINPALASLKHPANDLVKGQAGFSTYGGSWLGSLTTLENTTMYQFRADQPDTIKMTGLTIDPTSVNIPLSNGWNWIGYLPNYPLSVNNALASLSPASGDLIKGQYGFAQFIPPHGWIGNLNYLVPPQGYQIKLTGTGTLTYPPKSLVGSEQVAARGETETGTAYWNVDPTQFENSMTLVGMYANDEQNATTAAHEIGAFAGAELRGAAKALYVEPLDRYVFFLTVFSNGSGEQLRFKLHDSETGQVRDLVETMFFAPQQHQGSVEAPVPFTVQTTSAAAAHRAINPFLFEVQPNPFADGTLIRFKFMRDQEVQFTVTDLQGRELQRFRKHAHSGWNAFDWQPDLAPGVYFVRLQTADGAAVQKVVKE